MKKLILLSSILSTLTLVSGQDKSQVLIPTIHGDWWQLWSCIRHTNCGGNTRLFHRWEGESSSLGTPFQEQVFN